MNFLMFIGCVFLMIIWFGLRLVYDYFSTAIRLCAESAYQDIAARKTKESDAINAESSKPRAKTIGFKSEPVINKEGA